MKKGFNGDRFLMMIDAKDWISATQFRPFSNFDAKINYKF